MPRSLRSRLIVAETLDILGDLPLATVASSPTDRTPRQLPPFVLTPLQRELMRRVLKALSQRGAVVLAASVGQGKTVIALSAAMVRHTTIAVIGPATLRRQWVDTAKRMSLALTFHSLEGVSLGRLPPPHADIVLIDEAHRLRNPGTHRLRHLLPWLAGRDVVFITGTPIVNHPHDLIRLLRLVLPDDTLRLDGVRSLEALVDCVTPPAALAHLVVREVHPGRGTPIRRRIIPPPDLEQDRGERVISSLHRLGLGETPAIRRLIRTVLLDAAASSDVAWYTALRRYRLLLTHAREAGALSRAEIRAFTGICPDQGVLWELVRPRTGPSALPVGDLEIITEILAHPPRDAAWLEPLRAAIDGMTPTLLFTRHLATLDLVRRALGPTTAWVSGSAAGIGSHRLPRNTILRAFGPERQEWRARRVPPNCLVLSDVGAEGLDLQAARCVVHLDYPWHDTALQQRIGRAARIGQSAPFVIEVCRHPPAAIRNALDIVNVATRKGKWARRWLAQIAHPSPPTEEAFHLATERHDLCAKVTISSGRRMGEVGLGRSRRDGAWHPLDLTIIDGLTSRGFTLTKCLPGREPPDLLDAVHTLTAPGFSSRPDLVGRLLALASAAVRVRQRRKLVTLDALLQAANVTQSNTIEYRLAHASLEELLADPVLTRPGAADEVVLCQLIFPPGTSCD